MRMAAYAGAPFVRVDSLYFWKRTSLNVPRHDHAIKTLNRSHRRYEPRMSDRGMLSRGRPRKRLLNSKQTDNPSIGPDVDGVRRRHLGQARHGHDLTADRHDELGSG